MALDCEMDFRIPDDMDESDFEEVEDLKHAKFTVKNPGLVCKVTLVN
jgi:hypothetical protein